MIRILSLICLFLLSACAVPDKEKEPLVLQQAAFADLPGWEKDNQAQTLAAFKRSCERILKNDPARPFGPDGIGGVYGDWFPACQVAMKKTRARQGLFSSSILFLIRPAPAAIKMVFLQVIMKPL